MIPELQEQLNWCWAACARMAALHFGISVAEQCDLAIEFIPGAHDCCINGKTDACNQALDEAEIPRLFDSIMVTADALDLTDPVTEAMVREAVVDGLALLMLDFRSSCHFVPVDAVTTDRFQVADPKSQTPTYVDWPTLSSAYGRGSISNLWRIHYPSPVAARSQPTLGIVNK